MHEFYHYLKDLSDEDLPGRDAQMNLSPSPLDPDVVLPRNSSDDAHPSGVLIPLFPDNQSNLHVILTLRTRSIRHAGQISFPGGRREGDESLENTALRETEEEVGIPTDSISLARPITPLYLYRTNNQITPYVGFLNQKPELIPEPLEVEEAFTATLDSLLSNKYFKREKWELSGRSFDVPHWTIHRVPLWGATAMIISELLEIYRAFKESS